MSEDSVGATRQSPSGMAIANFDGFDVEHAPPLRWYHFNPEGSIFQHGRRRAHVAAAEGYYDY